MDTVPAMSRSQWFVSALLVWFITALLVAAIPRPDALPDADALQSSQESQTALTSALSAVAGSAYALCGLLWRLSSPVRPFTSEILTGYGLGQRWDMFAGPPKYVEYLRARYYVEHDKGGGSTVVSYNQLIYPELPPNKVRLVKSFAALHRDQVVMGIISRYHPKTESTAASEDYRAALRSVARYYSERFQAQYLKPTEPIERVELWHGTALIPPPEESQSRDAERLTTLMDYYAGPIERRVRRSALPQYSATEQEGDIGWSLEFIEDR